MKRDMRTSLLNFGLLLLTAVPSWAGTISLWSAHGDSCLVTPPGVGQVTVLIVMEDCELPTCTYFLGAQFRIEGLPTWVPFSVTLGPDVYSFVGQLFESGVTITYRGGGDLPPPESRFLSVALQIIPGTQMVLRIRPAIPAPDEEHPCPVFIGDACWGSQYTCVTGGALYINDDRCRVAAEPVQWSDVKQLYK